MTVEQKRAYSKTDMPRWVDHLRACAKEWHAMKRRAAPPNVGKRLRKKQPGAPVRVPRRVRGKQTDPRNDIN